MNRRFGARLCAVLMLSVPLLAAAPASAATSASAATTRPAVIVFLLHEVSVEEALALPQVQHLAQVGGSALLTNAPDLAGQALQMERRAPTGAASVRVIDLGTPPPSGSARTGSLERIDQEIGGDLAAAGQPGLVVVATLGASPAMQERGDAMNVVVVADLAGRFPLETWPTDGTILSSSSTKRAGVVTGTDLAPTVAAFSGVTGAGGAMHPVGFPGESPIPIHERYLAERRMYVPVGVAAGVAVLAFLALGLLVFFRRDRASRPALLAGQWACFATPALGLSLLAAGHLPTLDYAWVGALTAVVTVAMPLIALSFRGRGVLAPPLVFGGLVLAFFVVEAVAGWYGTMFTLLGGTALDGARFYGLPNAFEGLVVGSGVYVAAGLEPRRGFLFLLAVALFIGMPGLGADLGGAVVALVAAGLWLAFQVRGRFGWRDAGLALLTVIGGMVVILAAHRFLGATHGTAFVETETQHPLDIMSTAWSRLEVGFRLLGRNPVGLLYLAATPVLLWLVIRPRGGLRETFAEHPRWRLAMLVLLWALVVAYFVNDTGVSAVGLGFSMALGGVLYLPLATRVPLPAEPAKMEAA